MLTGIFLKCPIYDGTALMLELRIIVVNMWLKKEGSGSMRYEVITLTSQFCFHDLATLKFGLSQ